MVGMTRNEKTSSREVKTADVKNKLMLQLREIIARAKRDGPIGFDVRRYAERVLEQIGLEEKTDYESWETNW